MNDLFQCDYYYKWTIYADEVFKVNSNYKYKISKTEKDVHGKTVCDIPEPMGEFGVYNVTLRDDHCLFNVEKDPVNIYLCRYFVNLFISFITKRANFITSRVFQFFC